uniref:50S ribosomal protein L9, chloroplastic n=1 Tax=Porphyridium sordidum TaxID=28024 RepID=A0A1C9CDY8_PORSO|nr:ribosomal protein L9 [Porphyridium sordidum]AOM66608.1 ribosomal protein L9 [Porphyridium sordidum]
MVKKTVQVVLNKDIKSLGKIGDLKSVSLGYARNLLLPNSLASIATKSLMLKIQKQQVVKRQQEELLKQEKLKLKQLIEALQQITIVKKVGQNETIFGSVTAREVADIISKQCANQIDKKEVKIPEIEILGNYNVIIDLYPGVEANLKLQVLPEV